MDAPFGDWGTQTFVAGLTVDGLNVPWVIKGAMDGLAFAAYAKQVLVPSLTPGTVVILDNLATPQQCRGSTGTPASRMLLPLLWLPPVVQEVFDPIGV